MALFHLPVEVEDLENWKEDRLCVKDTLAIDKMTDDARSDIVAGSMGCCLFIEKCCHRNGNTFGVKHLPNQGANLQVTYTRIFLNNQNSKPNKPVSVRNK